jgi:hypothetical protein
MQLQLYFLKILFIKIMVLICIIEILKIEKANQHKVQFFY